MVVVSSLTAATPGGRFRNALWTKADFWRATAGNAIACERSVAGVERFENLIAWLRAHELHLEVWKATARAPMNRDLRFTNQIRDASESVERNVAEGWAIPAWPVRPLPRHRQGLAQRDADIARRTTRTT